MADIALIIGNGLDLNLGLPAKYCDSIKRKDRVDTADGFNCNLLSFLISKITTQMRHT